MAHEIGYYIERRVVVGHLSGEYTLDVARVTNQATVELIRAGLPPVHIILDVSEVTNYQITIKQVTEAATMLREPNLGWIIAVGGSPVARFLGSMIMQLGQANFRFVETLDEALNILERVDTTLAYAS